MKEILQRSAVLLVVGATWIAAGQTPARAQFRASVVKIDITPDKPQWLFGYAARQSEGVLDRLYHRIAALDDGKTQVFLVSTDICVIASLAYNDSVLSEVEKQTGVRASQVWWTATHTHSAPEVGPPGLGAAFMPDRFKQVSPGSMSNPEYSEFVKRTLVEGIREARSKLSPARLATGIGFSGANINRRAKQPSGAVTLGMNPDGPVDRQIGLIRLEHSDGKLLALIANYAMHGTVLGGDSRVISGDAPGVVAEYVEKQVGVPMLFINGAEGDVAPIYSVFPDPRTGHLNQFTVLLGDRIVQANQRMPAGTGDVVLRNTEKSVETPLKSGLKWPEELKDYLRVTASGQSLVRIPVHFLSINKDTAIWGAPLELFCEIAMDIRERSPFDHTFYFGLTGGWLGYLPTREAFHEKGYEPATSPFTDQAEEQFRTAVSSFLEGLPR